MNPKLTNLGIKLIWKQRAQLIYDWLAAKIKENGGVFNALPLADMVKQANVPFSKEPFRQALRALIDAGLIINQGSYRKPIYSLSEEDLTEIPEQEPEPEILDEIPERELEPEILDEIPEPPPDDEVEDDESVENLPALTDEEVPSFVETHLRMYHGVRRMYGHDVAKVYGVSTKRLIEAYKRHANEFKDGWVVQMSLEEWKEILQSNEVKHSPDEVELPNWSQSATSSKVKHSPEPPFMFDRDGINRSAFLFPQSPIAVDRANMIITVFTNMERLRYGEEPTQPNFAQAIDALVHRQDNQLAIVTEEMKEIARQMAGQTKVLTDLVARQHGDLQDVRTVVKDTSDQISDTNKNLGEVVERVEKLEITQKQAEDNRLLCPEDQNFILGLIRVAAQLRQDKYVAEGAYIEYRPELKQLEERVGFPLRKATNGQFDVVYKAMAEIVESQVDQFPERIQHLSQADYKRYHDCMSSLRERKE